MTLGSIAFKIHYLLLFRLDIKRVFRQTQLYCFFAFLGTAFLVMIWLNPDVPLVDILFQITSALGTCGLNTVDLNTWAMSPVFVLVILMILGANAGSTGGGIKTERFAWFAKGVWRSIKQVWRPEDEDAVVVFNGEVEEPKVVRRNIQQAANVLFLWLLTLSAGTFVLSVMLGDQYAFYQVLFDVSSALSNVGLSTGITGADMPQNAKYLLSLLMWLGRLEIMAVVILLVSPVYLLGNNVASK